MTELSTLLSLLLAKDQPASNSSETTDARIYSCGLFFVISQNNTGFLTIAFEFNNSFLETYPLDFKNYHCWETHCNLFEFHLANLNFVLQQNYKQVNPKLSFNADNQKLAFVVHWWTCLCCYNLFGWQISAGDKPSITWDLVEGQCHQPGPTLPSAVRALLHATVLL